MTLPKGLLTRALEVPIERLRKRKLAPVTVAILDSGIDGSHPDLAGRVVRGMIFEAAENGEVTSRESNPRKNNDVYGHGTGVASIIARIAPNASFIDVRVLGGQNSGVGDVTIAGLEHAVRSEANLLNMSLAVSEKYVPSLAALAEVAYRRGIVIVASRRNMPLQDEGFPAALIPCVGVDNEGKGPEGNWLYRNEVIEYSAHGVEVPVAAHGGGYTTMTGTSFATPIMCGHVALLLGAHPGLRPFEVKALLKAMAMNALPPRASRSRVQKRLSAARRKAAAPRKRKSISSAKKSRRQRPPRGRTS
jgi:subtilisin family serine protease